VQSFRATIREAPRGGAYVEVPDEVVDALGGGGRLKVAATFDGRPYRGSIVSMGGPTKILGLLKALRTELGKGPGDTVEVTVALDDAPRTVTVPVDLAEALAAGGRRGAFDAQSFSHRREWVGWIEEAKRPATRAKRIAATVERLGG
jgi:hypothetical protein